MKVCLVSAPVVTDFKKRDEIDSCLGEPAVSEPQLGVLSLAAVLEAHRDAVRIIDLDQAYLAHLNSPNEVRSFAEQAAKLIAADPADVYGFSSICSSYPLTIRIAEAVKAARPGSLVLFGGPQASVVDRQTLAAFSFVDFVLRGESETTLPFLLEELAGEGQLSRVPGLAYRCGSELCRNASPPIIEDLDAIPSPAYHLTGGLRGAIKASLELGRGCPFACTFCSTNDFFRRKFRLRSPGRVIRDMREIACAYGIKQFELVHDMFTVDRRRVVSFCEAMLASGDGFEWSCSARTDCVDEELLDLMARAGCVGIFYGVESGSQRLQKVFDKDLDVEQARQVVATTERVDMRSIVSLITGFPEETEDDLRLTLRMFMFSAQHPQSTPHLNILAPLAETPIHLKYRDQMTLGDLCSDISQQGPVQDPEDWNLIERHPEIFPNFYLLPTPHLDRGCLLELREFALNGVGHFRWLLCAIHQNTHQLYDLFLLWQKHRMEIHPLQNGPELKRYYNSSGFRRDFLSFVQSSPPAENRIVRALLEFEMAWASSSCSFAHEAITAEAASSDGPVCATDVPVRSPGANLIELSSDIQSVINAVKHEVEPVWELGSHYYVTPDSSDALKRLYGISRELGRLLQLCNGQQNVRKIVEVLAPEFAEIADSQGEAAVLGLINAAVQEGLVSIHGATIRRPSADAA
jgi:radical SAM family protein/B12 binding protein